MKPLRNLFITVLENFPGSQVKGKHDASVVQHVRLWPWAPSRPKAIDGAKIRMFSGTANTFCPKNQKKAEWPDRRGWAIPENTNESNSPPRAGRISHELSITKSVFVFSLRFKLWKNCSHIFSLYIFTIKTTRIILPYLLYLHGK